MQSLREQYFYPSCLILILFPFYWGRKPFEQESWEREDERVWGFLFLANHVIHRGRFLNSTLYYFVPVYTREMHHAKKCVKWHSLKGQCEETALPWGMNDNRCVLLTCAVCWCLILRCLPQIMASFVFHTRPASLWVLVITTAVSNEPPLYKQDLKHTLALAFHFLHPHPSHHLFRFLFKQKNNI